MQDENLQKKEETLKLENEVLKLKLMLERGASFGESEGDPLEAQMENFFLKQVQAFEEGFENSTGITVFERLGKPDDLRQVSEIADSEIDMEWERLEKMLNQNGLSVNACSPQVTNRELYRFVMEELFFETIPDLRMPGFMQCFIYDEFHPDFEYDNINLAIDYCVRQLLRKERVNILYCFDSTGLYLNQHHGLTEDEFLNLITTFQDRYEEIELLEVDKAVCQFADQECHVQGNYQVRLKNSEQENVLDGVWRVKLTHFQDLGFWVIAGVDFANLEF